ncbi:putative lipoprotein [Ferrimonas balearica DSM 9799]|uniref:Putative lipoprotein n=1 Tax=Ferrimonas balearica (strain DSM 9799 / CCM 4581 / KCTC 23876 / PAT) TaxID=550540 RepID=E1SPW8_FERBD|nr:alginate export family protein [Ferrimonas balearica]ADN75763.1 putative lipoprotein [Ferrimonas balearica DSM 9799]
MKRLSLISLALLTAMPAMANDSLIEALQDGKVNLDMRLRYENVSQDNALKDADGLTLRTRLTYATGDLHGFSALVEFEDSRVVAGIDDYNNAIGKNPDYSVIADPETTELDQAFLQYRNDAVKARLGRQVLTFDNHRFVGHVGWRQDRQTFDAASIVYTPLENLALNYAYITQRNRIFAEAKDVDAKDHLLNARYQTGIGALTGYAYLLEEDTDISNGLDTYGLRFAGSHVLDSLKLIYAAEYATQESDKAGVSFDADYTLVEGGIGWSGLTAKLGYEVLGSDDGQYGFATPLATLHKFNGWADQFLTTPKQGLVDLYASIGGPLLGGQWALVYHTYEADQATAGVDDLGEEWNVSYGRKFAKHYNAGIKYAGYSAGDVDAGKVDTDKVWVWAGVAF